MGYRELSRMEMVEVVRRWQMGESQRAIARASGVARETVKKYLRAAEELGLAHTARLRHVESILRRNYRSLREPHRQRYVHARRRYVSSCPE